MSRSICFSCVHSEGSTCFIGVGGEGEPMGSQQNIPTKFLRNMGIKKHGNSDNSGVRLCDLEPEQECSELAEHTLIISYVLKNNKKTEQS